MPPAASILKDLRDGPKGRVPEIRNAYRFLRGAHSTVEGILQAAELVARQRRVSNSSTAGRPSSGETDLYRSAIVMTSSGIDASMQRLIWDAGSYLIPRPGTLARKQYELGIKEELSGTRKVDEDLKAAVVAADPAQQLLRFYLSRKAKSSFQGSGDLKTRVRNTLGIPGTRVDDATLATLDRFFLSRNRIVHEMDYENVVRSEGRARRHRTRDEVVSMCNRAFLVTSDLVHATADVILAER
ncbi:hypothetical protein OED01_10640 [Microbacterium sp. M28]|uniref:hypothetical protein n=1 Tax=Microbacterium sp. M28 TaxID=2962064 RepID=UPI0021F4005E|nr:hypothetical protein [Microbacterium sp. M28]UYO96062.1 hypothetical protein OED01_10640 [Microbacterium sp. M28]